MSKKIEYIEHMQYRQAIVSATCDMCGQELILGNRYEIEHIKIDTIPDGTVTIGEFSETTVDLCYSCVQKIKQMIKKHKTLKPPARGKE